jgi:hypothetical protein
MKISMKQKSKMGKMMGGYTSSPMYNSKAPKKTKPMPMRGQRTATNKAKKK